MTSVNEIINFHRLAIEKVKHFVHARDLFKQLKNASGQHYNGIIGPRGVGKTIILRQLATASEQAIYISLDNLSRDDDLFEVVKKLHQDYRYRLFLLDEVYSHPAFDAALKKLYDLLDIRVVFTSSIALKMHTAAHDLSRRVMLHSLHPFTYREYVFFKHGVSVPPLALKTIYDRAWNKEHMRAGIWFDDYLRGGLMPFAMDEPEPLTLVKNILETIIHKDIASVARFPADELSIIDKVVAFIGRSGVDGINYSSLSANLKITKYKAEQYVGYLEDAFVLQRIFPKGTNVLKEPKVLMALPFRLLFRSMEDAAGGIREDFFAGAMRAAGKKICYLKSTRGSKTPDYVVDEPGHADTVIEIGGRGKGRSQFKEFSASRKFIFSPGDATDELRRPLFMLGYLSPST